VAAVWVLLVGGTDALAATNTVWCVPDTSISALCTAGKGKPHISDAATSGLNPDLAEGDVILVGPGYYHESVYVDTTNVYIFGAQAGNDARVGRNDLWKESVVDASLGAYGNGGGAAFYLETDNEVVDGFTIEGGTSGAYGSGIYEEDDTGVQILNNIIQNNAVGVYLYEGTSNLVEYNLFKTNNTPQAGPSIDFVAGKSGFGIAGEFGPYSYFGTSITENAFQGNKAAAVWLWEATGTEITKNTSEKDGSFFVCVACESTSFDHNRGQDFAPQQGFKIPLTSSPGPADAAVDLLYYAYGMQINDNVLEGGKTATYNGIAFSTIAGIDDVYDTVCDYCQVSNNTICDFKGNGIVAELPPDGNATLEYSQVSKNDVENNGGDGILIEGNYSTNNGYNALFENKAKDNRGLDCKDNTYGSFTLGTYDTWFNNSGNMSSPLTLCSRAFWH
jgi:parallel beta-helix repeat protein